jgi:acetyltransferase-like isoleucine patch superfamily enzyme
MSLVLKILHRFNKRITEPLAIEFGIMMNRLGPRIAQRTLPVFANHPHDVIIDLPRRISNPDCIHVGEGVRIGPGSLIMAVKRYPGITMQHPEMDASVQEFHPVMRIGNRVTATAGLQVTAHREVIIEDDVMFATNVHIEDGSHGYDVANKVYKWQPISHIAPVRIRRGCWIGQNVVILPGVTIGELVIIGANSVVTRSLPDRCIAFGAPARVMKIWDHNSQQWIAPAS